ncbi:MAG: hypothetical protein KGL74_09730, partial [Elusimicrobia bacterium]|nr:hypothetical protein [Elusimicrobiota bacterium]
MKRFLSGLVSLSLILLTPPPAAWAQFAEAARSASFGPGSTAGVQAGAVRMGSAIQLPALGSSALTSTLSSSLPAAAASAFLPTDVAPAVLPSAAVGVPAAAPVSAPALSRAAAASAPAAPSRNIGARAVLSRTG